jgi:hypothetical protein
MNLPNRDQAIIDERKLLDYCLSLDHDEGKHKAVLFRELLGLGQEDTPRLTAAIRQAVVACEAVLGAADCYGQRYVVDFEMSGPRGAVTVRSAWIVRTDEILPRLVTCYIM